MIVKGATESAARKSAQENLARVGLAEKFDASNEVLSVVRGLADEGMTLLMVTHEMRFAREVCDRVVFMHQGKVQEIGPPEEIFAHPKTAELQQFLGASN